MLVKYEVVEIGSLFLLST